jgi:hypothetical protein
MEVMKYAIKHDHVDAMDSAAPWLLDLPEDSVLDIFEQSKFLRGWVSDRKLACSNRRSYRLPQAKYYSACSKHLGAIYASQPDYITTKYHPSNSCSVADALPKAVLQAISIMRTDPASFRKTDDIFRGPLMTAAGCSECFRRLLGWKQKIAAGMDFVPKFSTLI